MSDQAFNATMSSEARSPVSPLVRGDSERIRNNLMYKLGVETERPKITKTMRARDTLLGNVQITSEPLKDVEIKGNPDDKPSSALWAFVSLFGGKKEGPTHYSLEDTPSLSSSFTSSEIGENTDSVRSVESMASPLRKLKFKEQVQVCLIPKREEYSKRIRGHLWNSPEEMAMNAHRNTVEFAAEGWDWRSVMEDENMYRCLATNELIHPVHIEQRSP